MNNYQKKQWINIARLCAIAAGASILLTSIYFAVVLPYFGFEFTMLDDYLSTIDWYVNEGTSGLFQGLMVLYFISQFVLLPLPFAAHKVLSTEENSVYSSCLAIIGTAAAILAMAGPIVIFANTPELVRVASEGVVPSSVIEMAANMFADLTKDFRLFSELLVGIWLIGLGLIVGLKTGQKFKSYLIALFGAAIFVIPAIKLVDPYDPMEDVIGLVLAVSFFVIGSLLPKHPKAPEDVYG